MKQKLLGDGADILTPAAYDDTGFMARNLVYTTLPHRRLDAVEWKREAGRFALRLSRAAKAEREARRICMIDDMPFGRPYGPKARLLLLYACTWALRQQDPHLPLGNTLAEFLRLVGLAPSSGGGRRSNGALMKDQLMRFWCTNVVFSETKPGCHLLRVSLSEEMRCQWLTPKEAPEAEAVEGSYMVLTDKFIRHINSPGVCVPLDLRAVSALSYSSLAMDLYGLLANRSFVAAERGVDQFLGWDKIAQQLGADYADVGDFRRHAVALLPAIANVYPRLDYRIQRGGRSRPSGLIVTSLSRPAIAAADEPPQLFELE